MKRRDSLNIKHPFFKSGTLILDPLTFDSSMITKRYTLQPNQTTNIVVGNKNTVATVIVHYDSKRGSKKESGFIIIK